MHERESEVWSVVSDPQRPHGLQPSRLLRSWDFPGRSTGVGCHCLFRVRMALQSKAIYVFNSIPIKIDNVCWRNGETDPQIHIELQKFSQVVLVVKNTAANTGDASLILGQGDSLEKGSATRSSILTWRIPWTAKPGGLQSIGSQRVGHIWSDLACRVTKTML